jgi:hypothetical protein
VILSLFFLRGRSIGPGRGDGRIGQKRLRDEEEGAEEERDTIEGVEEEEASLE